MKIEMKNMRTDNCKYYITDDGEVYRNDIRFSTNVNNSGYECVIIKKKTYTVHRLVASYFISNEDKKATVNHIDGNKLNNTVDNLEWNTYSENLRHAYDTGLKVHTRQALGVRKNFCRFNNVAYNQGRWTAAVTNRKIRYKGGSHTLAVTAAIAVNNIILKNNLDSKLNVFKFFTKIQGFNMHKIVPKPLGVNKAMHKNISFRNGKYSTGVRVKGIKLENKSFDTLEKAIFHRDMLVLNAQRLTQ